MYFNLNYRSLMNSRTRCRHDTNGIHPDEVSLLLGNETLIGVLPIHIRFVVNPLASIMNPSVSHNSVSHHHQSHLMVSF